MRGKFALFAVVLFVLLCTGIAIPRLADRGNPYQAVAGTDAERAFAYAALTTADQILDNPLEQLIVTRLLVSELRKSTDTDCEASEAATDNGNYEATVQAFTLFGIPYAQIEVNCVGAYRSGTVSWGGLGK